MSDSILIFKHQHSGDQVLDLLEKRIKDCDLVMQETPCIALFDALERAKYLRSVYESDVSREKFEKNMILTGDDYLLGLWRLIIDNKKPVISQESFYEMAGKKLSQRYRYATSKLSKKCFNALDQGNLGSALDYLHECVRMVGEVVKYRDINIANRLDRLDEIVANEWPELVGVRDKKVLLPIGYGHSPENYVESDIEVIVEKFEKEEGGLYERLPVSCDDEDECARFLLGHLITKKFGYNQEAIEMKRRILPNAKMSDLEEFVVNGN